MNYVETRGVYEIRNTVSVGLPIVLQVHLKVLKLQVKSLKSILVSLEILMELDRGVVVLLVYVLDIIEAHPTHIFLVI
jgi:hypothetical protein